MRRWSLVLLLSTASAALAQQVPSVPEPTPAPPAAAPAPPTTPTPAQGAPSTRRATAPTPPGPLAGTPSSPEDRSPEGQVRTEAGNLFKHLLNGDVRGGVEGLLFPFQLEDKRFESAEPLVAAWVKELRNKRVDLITLYDIEVLPYVEMEKKYGKPPARLGALVPRGADVYVAVANLSGHAAVVLYRQAGPDWRAFAYTD